MNPKYGVKSDTIQARNNMQCLNDLQIAKPLISPQKLKSYLIGSEMHSTLAKTTISIAISMAVCIGFTPACAEDGTRVLLQCRGMLAENLADKKRMVPNLKTMKEISILVTVLETGDGRTAIVSDGDYDFGLFNENSNNKYIIDVSDYSDDIKWELRNTTINENPKVLSKTRIYINRLSGQFIYDERGDHKEFSSLTKIDGYCEKIDSRERQF